MRKHTLTEGMGLYQGCASFAQACEKARKGGMRGGMNDRALFEMALMVATTLI